MIEKWLIAFDSTQQALRAEMLLDYAGVEIDLYPTPKEITAGCALSISFPGEALVLTKKVIVAEQIEIRGIFYEELGQYRQVPLDAGEAEAESRRRQGEVKGMGEYDEHAGS